MVNKGVAKAEEAKSACYSAQRVSGSVVKDREQHCLLIASIVRAARGKFCKHLRHLRWEPNARFSLAWAAYASTHRSFWTEMRPIQEKMKSVRPPIQPPKLNADGR